MNKESTKRIKPANRSKQAKKVILTALTISVCSVFATVTAYAEGGGFQATASDALVTVVTLIGGALGAWGVVNLLEGYGNDNPGAKSQGIKQAVAGVGLIIVGATIIPAIFN